MAKDFAFTVGDDEEITSQPPIKSIESQFEEFKQQQDKFNKELLQQLQKQQDYKENSIKQRDENLMKAIHEIQETRKEIATSQQKKPKWWQFWKKSEEE